MPYDFTSHVESIKPNDQTKHEQNHRYSEQNGGCWREKGWGVGKTGEKAQETQT